MKDVFSEIALLKMSGISLVMSFVFAVAGVHWMPSLFVWFLFMSAISGMGALVLFIVSLN